LGEVFRVNRLSPPFAITGQQEKSKYTDEPSKSVYVAIMCSAVDHRRPKN
jgi:hypothetical protein